MGPGAAAAALDQLVTTTEPLRTEAAYIEWTGKADAILRSAFGAGSVQVHDFADACVVKREGYTTARGHRHDLELWRQDAAERGKGVLKAAIFALTTLTADASPLDAASIDPGLWAHVQGLIADNDWSKVPAAVAIFVEDKVRVWAGDPRQRNGAVTVGKSLYATALHDSSPLRLGRQESEWEGWRSLGVGLAQAIGNVDRHRIQRRDDGRRYALGVLGLGSLLLTQLRYEHAAVIAEAEAEHGAAATSCPPAAEARQSSS